MHHKPNEDFVPRAELNRRRSADWFQRRVSRLLGKYEVLSLQTREAETQMLDAQMAYEDLKRDRDAAYQKYYDALKPRKPANKD